MDLINRSARPRVAGTGTRCAGVTWARDPRSFATCAVAVVLVASSLVVRLAADLAGAGWATAMRPWLDADINGRLPVAFESLCLMGAGAACAWQARALAGSADRWLRHWIAAAVVFALLGAEKWIGLHEVAASMVSAQYGTYRGGLLGTFVLPALASAALLVWAFRPFARELPIATRRGLALGAVLLLGGGVGVEMVEAVWIKFTGGGDVVNVVLANLEEGGEMLGSAVIASVLWRHVRG